MRRIYQERHQKLVSILDVDFADCLDRVPSTAGLHVTALLRPVLGRSDRAIVARATRSGVDISPPLSKFSITRPVRQGLVIGYGAIPTERIPAFDA